MGINIDIVRRVDDVMSSEGLLRCPVHQLYRISECRLPKSVSLILKPLTRDLP